MSFLPADPVLFGDPFPAGHPWHSPVGALAWEVQGNRKVHLVAAGRCTACRRGLPDCYAMRVTKTWRRSTCARCIRAGIIADTPALRRAINVLGCRRSANYGPRSLMTLGRAIGWWRACGANATRFPGYLDNFFVPSDVASGEAHP